MIAGIRSTGRKTRGRGFLWLVCVAAAIQIPAAAQTVEWYRKSSIGISGSSGNGVAAVSGAIYVAAGVTGQPVSGPVLWKYDQDGNQLWERDLETRALSEDAARGVVADATGAYVVGDSTGLPGQPQIFNDDAFIRKYDPNGNIVWTDMFGAAESSSATQAFGVGMDSTGIYVVGSTRGTLPGQTSLGDDDAFIRKYDLNGNVLWTRQFGTSAFDSATGVAVNATGVYISGTSYGILPGQATAGDDFVQKYDVNGNLQWTQQFGGSLEDFRERRCGGRYGGLRRGFSADETAEPDQSRPRRSGRLCAQVRLQWQRAVDE